MNTLPLEIKEMISGYMGCEYDLFLNKFKKWNGKKFYIILTITFTFSEHLHIKNIEFEISGNEFGYKLRYLENGIQCDVGENLNFDILNGIFKKSCHTIITQYTNYFKQVNCLSNIKLYTQGCNYKIDELKYYNASAYNLLKLLQIGV